LASNSFVDNHNFHDNFVGKINPNKGYNLEGFLQRDSPKQESKKDNDQSVYRYGALHYICIFSGCFWVHTILFNHSSIDSLNPWDKKMGDSHHHTVVADSQPLCSLYKDRPYPFTKGCGFVL
jgi:hypothetical protein